MASEKRHLAMEHQGIPFPTTGLGHSSGRRKTRLARVFWHGVLAITILLGLKTLMHQELHPRLSHDNVHGHSMSPEEYERLFLSIPSSESSTTASRAYATHPHLAGSSEDFTDAKTILELFQTELNIPIPSEDPIFSAGTAESRNSTLHITSRYRNKPSAWIDTYYPVLNTPLDRSLEILSASDEAVWSANLEEDGDPLDEDAHKYKDSVPAWHGLSKDGDAIGQLIYANYGTKEDYDNLVSVGTNLTGKIVIVRSGSVARGLKIKGAQELGASGVLIYSDPRDDGPITVENGFAPYPAGPARNPTSVERGSVQFLSLYPGDPTTPGYPAYEHADRVEASDIPNIPSLPISWMNAQRLMEEIGEIYTIDQYGKKLPSGKHSEARIKLVNHVDTKVTPIWNAMASIPGHIRDEVVIIGCHRDAWVLGAADPTSGTVSLHEIIRGFGALMRKGWKPIRTVVFASWDAEEYGLVGSTEWGEDFASWISEHAVAYLNVDVSVAGSRWLAGGSPSLANLIKQAALDIPHPTVKGKTLWDARTDEGPFSTVEGPTYMTIDAEFRESYTASVKEILASRTGISPLGSGSDYTVFLQRLGVASSDEGFVFTSTDAVYHYHSIYDSQRFQEVYADPGFHRHVAVAKHLGLLALRLIDSLVVPLNTTQYAYELDDYLDKVENIVPQLLVTSETLNFTGLRESIKGLQSASVALDKEKVEAERKFRDLLGSLPHRGGRCRRAHSLIRHFVKWIKGVFGMTAHHHQPIHHISQNDGWKYLLGKDQEAVLAMLFPESLGHGAPHKFPIRKLIKAAKRIAKYNKKIIGFERGFITKGGIKDREWYKHLGVAPGKWLGYGATTFPALTEALTIDMNTTQAKLEAARLVKLLDKLAHQINP